MRTASPLRYPGGKSAMASVLRQVRGLNDLGSRAISEPFAGGAGASLTLVLEEDAPKVYVNDLDKAVGDFWWALTKKCDEFVGLIESVDVSVEEWRKQRAIFQSKKRVSRIKRGFAAFYLNRCNRSGVIFNGGPIGGLQQNGVWKIDARFNKVDLIRRCRRIADLGSRISVSSVDGVEHIEALDAERTFFFIDPPYFEKGQSLYLNDADQAYHERLAEKLRSRTSSAWVLTYDDCPEIRSLYRGWANIKPFSLRYSASERRGGREILVTPKWMRLPRGQSSAAIGW